MPIREPSRLVLPTLGLSGLLLREILQRTGGNQVAASKLLGVSRTTLRNKFESLGLGQ
ncbi:MAG: helix-turn-helix domain-containing protein [Novipirellula sp. JB048]